MLPRTMYIGVTDYMTSTSNTSISTVVIVLKEPERNQCEWWFCTDNGVEKERCMLSMQQFPGPLYQKGISFGSLKTLKESKLFERLFEETTPDESGRFMRSFMDKLTSNGLVESSAAEGALLNAMALKVLRGGENEANYSRKPSVSSFDSFKRIFRGSASR